MSAHKGFTLIELMVAIGIMAVVFGLIISSSSAVKQSSRDTTRKSDLAKIQTAIEQYHVDQNYYPKLDNTPMMNPAGDHTYLEALPVDPSTGAPYCYVATEVDHATPCTNTTLPNPYDPTTACVNYDIFTTLENPPATTPPSVLGCSGNYKVGSQ